MMKATSHPVIYMHWHGDIALDLLKATRELMDGRETDLSYVSARFIGVCHENIDGNLSLGMWNSAEELKKEDSHGDAGCVIVDVSKSEWNIKCVGGYLESPK